MAFNNYIKKYIVVVDWAYGGRLEIFKLKQVAIRGCNLLNLEI